MLWIVGVEYRMPTPGGESGESKNINERYLVDALSATEATERLMQWLPANYKEPQITGVAKSNVKQVFTNDGSGFFWLCRFSFTVTNEKTGKERKSTFQNVVEGPDFIKAAEFAIKRATGDDVLEMLQASKFRMEEDLFHYGRPKPMASTTDSTPRIF